MDPALSCILTCLTMANISIGDPPAAPSTASTTIPPVSLDSTASTTIPPVSLDSTASTTIPPVSLDVLSRQDWLAQPPTMEGDPLKHPIPWVIISHTGTESCHTRSQCVLRARLIQSFHMESRSWNDIAHNFLVGGDGSVITGRGWDVQGAHTRGYNYKSIGISLIGTFNSESPTDKQIEAVKKLIEWGVAIGKLSSDYVLFGQRQLTSTLSPGDEAFDIIKTWPHFSEQVQ